MGTAVAEVTGLAGTPVLVTGGSGFIGSHVVDRLLDEDADVHVVTSAVSSVYPVRLTGVRSRITLHEASLADRTAMEAMVREAEPRIVLHLGAYTHVGKSWQRVDECVQVNVQGTVNLLQALAGIGGVERFVNVGTSEIYGAIDVPFREDAHPRPVSPYAVSKYAAEMYARLAGMSSTVPVVRIRPFNAYGPAQTPDRVVPEIILRGLRRMPLKMTAGTQTREFNYVSDLVDGLVRAATVPGIEGELFNLGCGEEVTIAQLATTILELLGDPIQAHLGALPERPIEIPRMYADATRARERLGWAPQHDLRAGLQRTIAWYERELAADRESPFLPGSDQGR